MSTTAQHRVDNGPTVRITKDTLLSLVTPGSLDRGRHRARGRWDDSVWPPATLVAFGLILMAVGRWWW